MAFHFLLRRASSASTLPLGIRSAAGAMSSSVFKAEKRRGIGNPFSRFSTTSGLQHCINIIESGPSSPRASNMTKTIPIPDDFPFEIETNKRYHIELAKKYLFRRKYQGEIIEVGADGYEVVYGEPRIAMTAHVIRGYQKLQFDMIAEPDQIYIPACTMENTTYGHPMRAFEDYLQIRGFNRSTMKFLKDCIWKPVPGSEHLYVIDYDYTAQKSSFVPDVFPFTIQDRSIQDQSIEENKILLFLQRQYEDETIEAEVEVDSEDLLKPDPSSECSLQISVNIVHGDTHMNLLTYFHPDDPLCLMNVYEMSMSAEDGHLKAFQEFWEIRGIKPSTTNFMLNYLKKQDELGKIAKGLVHFL